MLRRDDYLMQGSADISEEDDLVYIANTKSRNPFICDNIA